MMSPIGNGPLCSLEYVGHMWYSEHVFWALPVGCWLPRSSFVFRLA
jgi:hypothetical protein